MQILPLPPTPPPFPFPPPLYFNHSIKRKLRPFRDISEAFLLWNGISIWTPGKTQFSTYCTYFSTLMTASMNILAFLLIYQQHLKPRVFRSPFQWVLFWLHYSKLLWSGGGRRRGAENILSSQSQKPRCTKLKHSKVKNNRLQTARAEL